METPRTRYARSGQLAIAYQVHGSGERDILLSSGTASNVETIWDIPEAARFFERLGRFTRVIRFDRRDSGLSDPSSDDLTLEAHADDALAVLDATGAERPVLIGSLDGARSLALLAATRPQRVGGLIAFSPTARGGAAGSSEFANSVAKTVAEFADFPSHEVLSDYAPDWAADPVRSARLTRYFQTAFTPNQAARMLRLSLLSDIGSILPLVQSPTLVLHPRDLQMVSTDAVREFVDLIPDARYREIPGNAGLHFTLDVDLISDIIEEFITGSAPAPSTNRTLATVLFTDLVGSTERAARSGDRVWSAVLERHLVDAQTAVTSHGGETIKSTGDGLLALFTGPGHGVRCAQEIIRGARGLGLEVRTGLHTGEVERGPDDVAGLAVHLAARIMGLAEPGEVLVSSTVHDLVLGSELTFSGRREQQIRGIPGTWATHSANQ